MVKIDGMFICVNVDSAFTYGTYFYALNVIVRHGLNSLKLMFSTIPIQYRYIIVMSILCVIICSDFVSYSHVYERRTDNWMGKHDEKRTWPMFGCGFGSYTRGVRGSES